MLTCEGVCEPHTDDREGLSRFACKHCIRDDSLKQQGASLSGGGAPGKNHPNRGRVPLPQQEPLGEFVVAAETVRWGDKNGRPRGGPRGEEIVRNRAVSRRATRKPAPQGRHYGPPKAPCARHSPTPDTAHSFAVAAAGPRRRP